MKKLSFAFYLFFTTNLFANLDILKMQGCFDVTFEFKEVETSTGATPSKDYFAKAKELIVVDKNTPDEIHLQHILISKAGIIKHWRQEWYSTSKKSQMVMDHTAPNVWKRMKFPVQENVWVQYVTNTDDAPRYSCASSWNNKSWKCSGYAPLPRREYTKRNDYNMMHRGNKVIITKNGWIHAQENIKLFFDNGNNRTTIGKEIGTNTYVKIDDVVCEQALKWWEIRKPYWLVVQNMWRHVFEEHSPLLMDVLKGEEPLSTKLDNIVEQNLKNSSRETALKKVKKQAHDVIHEFINEEDHN